MSDDDETDASVQLSKEPGKVVIDTEPENVVAENVVAENVVAENVVTDMEPANVEVYSKEPIQDADLSITSLKKNLSTLTSFIEI